MLQSCPHSWKYAPASWHSVTHFTSHNISFKFPTALKPKGLAMFPFRMGAFPQPLHRDVMCHPSSVHQWHVGLGEP